MNSVIWWYAQSTERWWKLKTRASFCSGGGPFIAENKRKCRNSSTGGVSNDEKECLTHKQSTNPHWGGDKRKETVQKRRERLIHNSLKQDRGAEKWALLFKAALALRQVWEMTTGVAVSHPLLPSLLKKIYKCCWECFRRLLSNLRGETYVCLHFCILYHHWITL